MDVLIPKKKWSFLTRWWWLVVLVLAGTGVAITYWPKPGRRLHVTANWLPTSSFTLQQLLP